MSLILIDTKKGRKKEHFKTKYFIIEDGEEKKGFCESNCIPQKVIF